MCVLTCPSVVSLAQDIASALLHHCHNGDKNLLCNVSSCSSRKPVRQVIRRITVQHERVDVLAFYIARCSLHGGRL